MSVHHSVRRLRCQFPETLRAAGLDRVAVKDRFDLFEGADDIYPIRFSGDTPVIVALSYQKERGEPADTVIIPVCRDDPSLL